MSDHQLFQIIAFEEAHSGLEKELNKFTEMNASNEIPFDTIRSSFQERGELYPGSNFTTRLHIEICVRNQELIKGYFLRVPIEVFNPFLDKPANECKRSSLF